MSFSRTVIQPVSTKKVVKIGGLFDANAVFFNVLIFAFSSFYAYILSSGFPIDSTIKDRSNYLNYVTESGAWLLYYISEDLAGILSNEPAWLFLNFILGQFFLPEQAVFLLIFFIAFFTSYLVLSYNSRYLFVLFFFLFLPPVIVKQIVHLRQGLAITLFLFGWFFGGKKFKYFVFFLTPFVHSSFFFILLILFLSRVFEKLRLSLSLRLLAIFFLGVSLSFGLSFIATALGARQADSIDSIGVQSSVSGLGFIFWIVVLCLYILQGRRYCYQNCFSILILVFYLSTYLFTKYTGRIFESGLIFVLFSSLSLTSWRRLVFYLLIFCFFVISWMLRLGKAYWGFGVEI